MATEPWRIEAPPADAQAVRFVVNPPNDHEGPRMAAESCAIAAAKMCMSIAADYERRAAEAMDSEEFVRFGVLAASAATARLCAARIDEMRTTYCLRLNAPKGGSEGGAT